MELKLEKHVKMRTDREHLRFALPQVCQMYLAEMWAVLEPLCDEGRNANTNVRV